MYPWNYIASVVVLELMSLLPQLPKCCNYRYVALSLAFSGHYLSTKEHLLVTETKTYFNSGVLTESHLTQQDGLAENTTRRR